MMNSGSAPCRTRRSCRPRSPRGAGAGARAPGAGGAGSAAIGAARASAAQPRRVRRFASAALGLRFGEQRDLVAAGGRVHDHGRELELLLEQPLARVDVLHAHPRDQRAADDEGAVADVDPVAADVPAPAAPAQRRDHQHADQQRQRRHHEHPGRRARDRADHRDGDPHGQPQRALLEPPRPAGARRQPAGGYASGFHELERHSSAAASCSYWGSPSSDSKTNGSAVHRRVDLGLEPPQVHALRLHARVRRERGLDRPGRLAVAGRGAQLGHVVGGEALRPHRVHHDRVEPEPDRLAQLGLSSIVSVPASPRAARRRRSPCAPGPRASSRSSRPGGGSGRRGRSRRTCAAWSASRSRGRRPARRPPRGRRSRLWRSQRCGLGELPHLGDRDQLLRAGRGGDEVLERVRVPEHASAPAAAELLAEPLLERLAAGRW